MSESSTIQMEQALEVEAVQLEQIASRLEKSIEQFESFLQCQRASHNSPELAVERSDSQEESLQIARDLREERRMLISAWEQLEREQRQQLELDQRGGKGGSSASSASPGGPILSATSGGVDVLPGCANVPVHTSIRTLAATSILPVMPSSVSPVEKANSNSIAKRQQFRQLQREIDRPRS